jgi:SAM-dependent methyltransferase
MVLNGEAGWQSKGRVLDLRVLSPGRFSMSNTKQAQDMSRPPTQAPHSSTCLLCGCSKSQVVQQLTGQQLRAIWKELGMVFSPGAWGKIGEDFIVARRRCEACGFSFFDPSLGGNEAFYRELEHPHYFSPEREEFARTLQLIRKKGLRRVLDVGCGSGFFLDLARGANCETCGLELNPAAAEKARAKKHAVWTRLLHEVDREQLGGGFDLITFFQLIEHVPDPVTVLQQASRFLNPGGFIAVAVPAAQGVGRFLDWDPHQWPPHHLSRWRPRDFHQLAVAAHLELVESGGDMLLGSGIEDRWKMANRMASLLGKPKLWGGNSLPEAVSFIFRKTGMKFLFRRHGTSIYGYFKNAEPSASSKIAL